MKIPKLEVTVNGAKHSFPMYWESESVLCGGEWQKGLAMRYSDFYALMAVVGDDCLAGIPMYCYNEGLEVSGTFEDMDEVTIGTWEIKL